MKSRLKILFMRCDLEWTILNVKESIGNFPYSPAVSSSVYHIRLKKKQSCKESAGVWDQLDTPSTSQGDTHHLLCDSFQSWAQLRKFIVVDHCKICTGIISVKLKDHICKTEWMDNVTVGCMISFFNASWFCDNNVWKSIPVWWNSPSVEGKEKPSI